MMYLLALSVVFLTGLFLIRLLLKDKLNSPLIICLAGALGLGMVSQIIFYVQLVGGFFNPLIIIIISLLLLGIIIWLNKGFQVDVNCDAPWGFLIFPALACLLWLQASHFPMGGWDAWSCWNLKAKFIYFGHEQWKNVLDPILWRSNTGYPLGLPCLNVWFWQWTGFSQSVLMFNTILLTLLTAGVLFFGLQSFTLSFLESSLVTLSVFTLAFGQMLLISQYSDILFSLYLLCAFVCFAHYHHQKNKNFLILTGLFIGLLAFTKNEGLAASSILALLICLQKPKHILLFLGTVALAALPMLIFTFLMAPHSQAFINGLLSAQKPSNLERFIYILKYSFFELISIKWMGLWILALVGLVIAKANAFKSPFNIIGLFVGAYLIVIIGYYQINTFFEIKWWMDNTLHRIIFALMPSIFLWLGVSLFKKGA